MKVSVPFGDGGNPSPLGEEKFVEVPEGDEIPPTEVGGLRGRRAPFGRIPFDARAAIPRLEAGGCSISVALACITGRISCGREQVKDPNFPLQAEARPSAACAR